MRQFRFKDQQDIIGRHELAVQAAYQKELERLERSGLPGTKKLLKNLTRARRAENFLEYLAEFNIAKIFLDNEVVFEYEPKGGDDFVWDNHLLSVKSIQPKDYENDEDFVLDSLEKELQGGLVAAKRTLTRGLSETEIVVRREVTGITSWERIETGKGEPLLSDLKHGGPIMRHLAALEQVTSSGKKILFLFKQAEEFQDYIIEDIARWYFQLPNPMPLFGNVEQYNRLFVTPTGMVQPQRSISAIVYMHRPGSVLVWPDDCTKEMRDGRERLMIFGNDAELNLYLRDLLGGART